MIGLKRPKIGLALGGGGARGLAHVGVLKILERENIPVDFIAGTSAGSLIGAMYAIMPDANLVEKRLKDFLYGSAYKKLGLEKVVKRTASDSFFSQIVTYLTERIVINVAYSRISLISNKKFIAALRHLVKEIQIEQTKIPFCAVATDLIGGKDVFIKTGNIITAVTASSSIPGFLPPVSMANYLLLDGAVNNTVPVDAVFQLGADVVIAVNVSRNLEEKDEYDNIFEIITRTNQITSYSLTRLQLEKADVILRPEVGRYHWSEFNHIDFLITAGMSEAQRHIKQIKKVISRRYFFMKKYHLIKSSQKSHK